MFLSLSFIHSFHSFFLIWDDSFRDRRTNRGFESVAVAPGGLVYAVLEAALWGSDLVRVLELDPASNTTRILCMPLGGDA